MLPAWTLSVSSESPIIHFLRRTTHHEAHYLPPDSLSPLSTTALADDNDLFVSLLCSPFSVLAFIAPSARQQWLSEYRSLTISATFPSLNLFASSPSTASASLSDNALKGMSSAWDEKSSSLAQPLEILLQLDKQHQQPVYHPVPTRGCYLHVLNLHVPLDKQPGSSDRDATSSRSPQCGHGRIGGQVDDNLNKAGRHVMSTLPITLRPSTPYRLDQLCSGRHQALGANTI